MWPLWFELGSWWGAAIALGLAPRTQRRPALLVTSCLVALAAGVLTRLICSPCWWNPYKVAPLALVAATAGAALVALAFVVLERWSPVPRALLDGPVVRGWSLVRER